MNEDILVLRAVNPEADLPIPGPSRIDLGGAQRRKARPFLVERIRIDRREMPSIREERGVLAAAASVPLKLHRPLRKNSQTAATSPDAWGVRAVAVPETTLSGSGATLAILDTGIDRSHVAFEHLADRIVQRDFTGEGDADQDPDGHGTHCAGTAFGGPVGSVQIGVAPGVSRALIGKVIGRQGASSAILAQAIDWAVEQGANVISMSLGIDFPGKVAELVAAGFPAEIATAAALDAYRDTLDFFSAVAERANHSGQPLVFIAAAGNASRYDENPGHVIGVEPPAAARGFISVGALGQKGANRYFVGPFSNGGPRLCGPGVDILSARAGSGSGLAIMSGTSMATPHVAGVAALWYESLRQVRGQDFKSELLVDKIVGSARDDCIERTRLRDAGKGLVQAPIE